MIHHSLLARVALTTFCVVQGVAQVIIDAGRSHARNPLWLGHARFHVMWQSVTVLLLSGVAAALIWIPDVPQRTGFLVAAMLAGVSPLAFVMTALLRKRFSGTLHDPGSFPPLRLSLGELTGEFDMNLVAVLFALLFLSVVVALD